MKDTLRISLLESPDPKKIIAVARRGNDMASETISCTNLRNLLEFRSLIEKCIDGKEKRPDTTQLEKYSNSLFKFIFKKKLHDIYNRCPDEHIRIQIYCNHRELQFLPWEYMAMPGDLPGPNSKRSIVRVVPTIGIEPPHLIDINRTIRILFIFSDPIDQEGIDWIIAKKTIENQFRSAVPNNFDLDIEEGVDSKTLVKKLQSKNYNILHFFGHGQIIDGVGHLLLRDVETRKSEPFSASYLGILLRDKNLNLVLFSSCNTSAGDFKKEYAVIAKTLIRAGVPAVVSYQFPITNNNAALFAETFYRELLKHGDMDRATTRGREMLYLCVPSINGAKIEYGFPTIYRHINSIKFFKI